MGARFRLKASYPIDPALRGDTKAILRAMKKYGLLVADNGTDMYVTGTYDTRWDNEVLNPAFGALTGFLWQIGRILSLVLSLAATTVPPRRTNDARAPGRIGTFVRCGAPGNRGCWGVARTRRTGTAYVPASIEEARNEESRSCPHATGTTESSSRSPRTRC